jgi:hypothetical protein
MNITTNSLARAAAILFTTFAAACGGETASEPASEPGDEAPGDPTAAMSADGLSLDVAEPDHAAGTFDRSGVGVRFDFRREGDVRHAVIATAEGSPLLDTKLAGGIDTTVYFGGKATAKGPVDGEIQEKTGDESAFAEVASAPEMKLLPELKEALLASHRVAEDLFRAAPAADDANGLSPQALGDGIYHRVYHGGTWGFWSWSWWGTTTVVIGRANNWTYGYFAGWFRTSMGAFEYVNGYGRRSYARNWWGAYVTVGNNLAPLCSVSSPASCQDTSLYVTAY